MADGVFILMCIGLIVLGTLIAFFCACKAYNIDLTEIQTLKRKNELLKRRTGLAVHTYLVLLCDFSNEFWGNGVYKIYKVETADIYHVLGKLYSYTLTRIDYIAVVEYNKKSEKVWLKKGATIEDYVEEKDIYEEGYHGE